MDLRKSFLKPLKKLKDKLPGDHRKRYGRSRSGSDGNEGETDVEGSEASRRNSFLRSEVGVESVVESGPSQEGNDIGGKEGVPVDDPRTSTSSISRSGNLGGT